MNQENNTNQTVLSDEEIIDLYWQRQEQAIKETDLKYGRYLFTIAYNIVHDRLDCEECLNDTYLGTWNAIPPQKPNPLLAFVCRIVRNISIDRHRMNAAMKRDTTYDVAMSEIEYCVADPVSVEDRIEAKVLARLIENFLDTLSEENRVIFMRRYWFSDSYADIAAQTGLSEKNVSVRLTRTRKQLREYLIQKEVLV
jgi:RNA polymerase sigma-70 factor (ECF subfamily)